MTRAAGGNLLALSLATALSLAAQAADAIKSGRKLVEQRAPLDLTLPLIDCPPAVVTRDYTAFATPFFNIG
jgi:hypothetical protein